MKTGTILSMSTGGDDDDLKEEIQQKDDDDKKEEKKGEFNWLEEWAIQGKDAVALMKVQERTQRVMLAQLTEDRIYDITLVLEKLVDEATGEIADADVPKAKELAMETRNLQKEYKDLVTGAPSSLLDTFSNLDLSSNDKKKDDGDKKQE